MANCVIIMVSSLGPGELATRSKGKLGLPSFTPRPVDLRFNFSSGSHAETTSHKSSQIWIRSKHTCLAAGGNKNRVQLTLVARVSHLKWEIRLVLTQHGQLLKGVY